MQPDQRLTTYRRYFLDGEGRTWGAEWFEAADDDQALQLSEPDARTHTVDVWQRGRPVGRRYRQDGEVSLTKRPISVSPSAIVTAE